MKKTDSRWVTHISLILEEVGTPLVQNALKTIPAQALIRIGAVEGSSKLGRK